MEISPFSVTKDIFENDIIEKTMQELNKYDFELIPDEILDTLNENVVGRITFYCPVNFKKTKAFSKYIVAVQLKDEDDYTNVCVYLHPDYFGFFRKLYLKKTKNKRFNINHYLLLDNNRFFLEVVMGICHEILYKAKQSKYSKIIKKVDDYRYPSIEDVDEMGAFAHDAAIELYYKNNSRTIKRFNACFVDDKIRRKFRKKTQKFLEQIKGE